MHRGFSLIELLVVLLILVGLASVVAPLFTGTTVSALYRTTDNSAMVLRATLMGVGETAGYAEDMGGLPTKIHDLFAQGGQAAFDPITKLGWRGPYLNNPAQAVGLDVTFANVLYTDPVLAGDSVAKDAWGNPFIVQLPLGGEPRLVSAGADGALDTLIADAGAANRDDDRVYFLTGVDAVGNTACP